MWPEATLHSARWHIRLRGNSQSGGEAEPMGTSRGRKTYTGIVGTLDERLENSSAVALPCWSIQSTGTVHDDEGEPPLRRLGR